MWNLIGKNRSYIANMNLQLLMCIGYKLCCSSCIALKRNPHIERLDMSYHRWLQRGTMSINTQSRSWYRALNIYSMHCYKLCICCQPSRHKMCLDRTVSSNCLVDSNLCGKLDILRQRGQCIVRRPDCIPCIGERKNRGIWMRGR